MSPGILIIFLVSFKNQRFRYEKIFVTSSVSGLFNGVELNSTKSMGQCHGTPPPAF